jgi:hypothetical protein
MKDLTEIPEIYHPIFLTDWNLGHESNMNPIQRSQMMKLWLDYMKWDLNKSTSTNNDDEVIMGFID